MSRIILACFISLCCLNLANARGGGGFSSSSFGGHIHLGLSYISIETKDNPQPDSAGNVSGTGSDAKNTYIDLKLGYLSSENLYVGGIYSTYGRDVTGLSTKRSLMGATVGYHSDGYFLDLSYYLSGQLNDRYTSGEQYSNPSGYSIDFGYNAMMTSNFYLGAEISTKSITYKKYKPAGGSEVSTSWSQTELYPMLSLGFLF